jgi:hypothetical protein
LPARAALLPATVLLFTALLFAVSHSNPLVDTWLSLAAGRHISAHGVDDVDPFSFASRPSAAASLSPGAGMLPMAWAWLHPTGWINQKWLTHLALFHVHRLGGGGALLAWKIVLYALLTAALLRAALVRGASWLSAAATAALALLISRPYLEIRAQDVTNLALAALMLVLALAGRGRARAFWLLPPLFAVWSNAHGGFVFGVLLVVVFVAVTALAGDAGEDTEGDSRAVLHHGAAALAVSLAVAVAASPYRLANLTHPLGMTAGKNAALWRTIVEWRPSWKGTVAESGPVVLLALAVVAAAALATLRRKERASERPAWQDVAVAGAAVGLAVSSLRFVPVAAFVCAPLLAGWWDAETGRRAASRTSGRAPGATRRAAVTAGALWLAAAAAVIGFAVRFSSTYLAPWPGDRERTSALDRMTGSFAFPEGVCAFLAANRVSGRLWVPWDAAGYVLWRQTPDAATGQPPVQVLIDGRAQDVFTTTQFQTYLDLAAGGPTGRLVTARGTPPNAAEAAASRAWVERELRRLGIWLFDVSRVTQRTWATMAVLNLPAWQPVYLDDEHTLLADTATADGAALSTGVDTGATRFPEPYSALLTRARRAQAGGGAGRDEKVVILARQAYEARVSPRAVRLAADAAQSPAGRARAEAFWRAVADDFFARQAEYRDAHGYGLRLLAAQAALELLAAGPFSATGAAATAGRRAELARERARVEAALLW